MLDIYIQTTKSVYVHAAWIFDDVDTSQAADTKPLAVDTKQTLDTKPAVVDTKAMADSKPVADTKPAVADSKPMADSKLVADTKPLADTRPVMEIKSSVDTKPVVVESKQVSKEASKNICMSLHRHIFYHYKDVTLETLCYVMLWWSKTRLIGLYCRLAVPRDL